MPNIAPRLEFAGPRLDRDWRFPGKVILDNPHIGVSLSRDLSRWLVSVWFPFEAIYHEVPYFEKRPYMCIYIICIMFKYECIYAIFSSMANAMDDPMPWMIPCVISSLRSAASPALSKAARPDPGLPGSIYWFPHTQGRLYYICTYIYAHVSLLGMPTVVLTIVCFSMIVDRQATVAHP